MPRFATGFIRVSLTDGLKKNVTKCIETGKYRCNFELSFFVAMDTDKVGSGGGFFPYMGYIGMCGPKGYVFLSRFG